MPPKRQAFQNRLRYLRFQSRRAKIKLQSEEDVVSNEEKKDTPEESTPSTPKEFGAKRPAPPAPPTKPEAPSESNIQDKDAMPDLDAFNFMKW